MLSNVASTHAGILVSQSAPVLLAPIWEIWDVEGAWQDLNILPSKAKIKISPAHLALVGLKILSVLHFFWHVC